MTVATSMEATTTTTAATITIVSTAIYTRRHRKPHKPVPVQHLCRFPKSSTSLFGEERVQFSCLGQEPSTTSCRREWRCGWKTGQCFLCFLVFFLLFLPFLFLHPYYTRWNYFFYCLACPTCGLAMAPASMLFPAVPQSHLVSWYQRMSQHALTRSLVASPSRSWSFLLMS